MERFNRAERRRQVARLKKNRKGYWGRSNPWSIDSPMNKKQLGKVVQYPASCSCWMCGNPRHKHKGALTIQERRLFQDND